MKKKKIPGFITVRTTSTRLPEKCLRSFGEGNVLEHMVNRCRFYDIDPVICTSTDKTDDIVEEIARNQNVKFFRGSLENKLRRWLECCKYFELDGFHTVDADDPFFDGNLMRKSYELLDKGYDMVCPTESSSAGGASVGYSLTKSIVEKACSTVSENENTEMMWYYIDKVDHLKKAILTDDAKHPMMRLTLDYEEDYWLLETVRKVVGNLATRNEVDDLFMRNPDLYKVNWFRNVEWKQAQLDKKV